MNLIEEIAPVVFIPSLLEDRLDAINCNSCSKIVRAPCHMFLSSSNSVTMTEIMQLGKVARSVTYELGCFKWHELHEKTTDGLCCSALIGWSRHHVSHFLFFITMRLLHD